MDATVRRRGVRGAKIAPDRIIQLVGGIEPVRIPEYPECSIS